MKQLDLARMVKVYEAWANALCAPVYWGDGTGRTRNGTMTFLRTDTELLGITNAHVARALRNCTDEPGKQYQIGGAFLNPKRLIAEHAFLDLATFRLSDILLDQVGLLSDLSVGKGAKHRAATVTSWPPMLPSEGAPAMFGGYPGMYREPIEGGNVAFTFAWFAATVQNVSPTNVGIVIDIESSLATSQQRIPANADLGGWSGGPVFRIVEDAGIERLELTSIIYEYSSNHGIVMTHPLTDLKPDGTFSLET